MLSSHGEDTKTVTEDGGSLGGTRRDVVKLILENILRKRKGAVVSESAKHFMEGLRIIGGEGVYNYVSYNLGLHDERTMRRETVKTRGDRAPFLHGLTERNFVLLSQFSKCFQASRQELRWGHDMAIGELIGGCGELCAVKCQTIKYCRSIKCGDEHGYSDDPKKTGMITDKDEVVHKALVDFVSKNRLGTHLRVVIVNPLDKRYPLLPVLIEPHATLSLTRVHQTEVEHVADPSHQAPVVDSWASSGARIR
jgi:hypothetical protein